MANFFHLLRNSNLFCNCITETDSVLTNSNRMIKKEKQIERNKKRESIVPASNLERLRVRILAVPFFFELKKFKKNGKPVI